jgi:hypothetical protein
MPERAINTKSATGFLLILLPAALLMSLLFVAWPFILGVTVLMIGGNVWQNYEWSKTAGSIDPVFKQLIVQNRGEITPIDLSLQANISSKVASRYLVTKADEFGTGSRQHPERGQVYYFVSVSTLGSILDDSERDVPEIESGTTPAVSLPVLATRSVKVKVTQPQTTEVSPIPTTIPEPISQPEPPVVPPPISESSNITQLLDETSDPQTVVASVKPTNVDDTNSIPSTFDPAPPVENRTLVTILQSELAKRLDVHSSTVYKRRSEPNFTDWTRNRDPEGIGWGYAEATKEYYRVDV